MPIPQSLRRQTLAGEKLIALIDELREHHRKPEHCIAAIAKGNVQLGHALRARFHGDRMPVQKHDSLQRILALEGAATRLQRLLGEMAQIYRLFPELKGHRPPRPTNSAESVSRRPRRPSTATDRRKISAGMRKYWARRKAEQAKASRHAD